VIRTNKFSYDLGVKIDLSKYDINLTASLLKVFFRDLPQAPLPLEFVNSVGDVAGEWVETFFSISAIAF